MNRSSSDSDELYGLVRKVLRLSRRFGQTLDEPLESSLGLNIKELLVLSAIMDGAATPSAVAEAHSLPAPTVTRIVTKLVEAGLVQRVTDPSDLRRQRLELTPEGAQTRSRTRQVGKQIVGEQFGHLEPAQIRAALEALSALEEALFAAPSPLPKAAPKLEARL